MSQGPWRISCCENTEAATELNPQLGTCLKVPKWDIFDLLDFRDFLYHEDFLGR